MHLPNTTETDERMLRRDRACVAAGLGLGAGLGALAGAVASPIAGLLIGIGALGGAVVGRLIAPRIAADDVDPTWRHRSHVGANSPDDDLAGS
jgi:hypothetical protein